MSKLKYIKLFENFEKEEGEENPKLKGHNYTIEDLRKKGHNISNYKIDKGEVISIDGIDVNKWIQEHIEESEPDSEKEESE
jgi:hypothetical protein